MEQYLNMKLYTKIILLIFALFLVLPLVMADDIIIRNGAVYDLKRSCVDGTWCSASVVCNITIFSPTSSLIVGNQQMTNQISYFNYTLNTSQTSLNGDYLSNIACSDGISNGTDSFFFRITPNGEISSTANAIFYIGLLAVLIFFLGVAMYSFVIYESLGNRVGMLGLSYLLLIAITFIGWNMALDFITSSPFIAEMMWIFFLVLMVGLLPLFLGGFIFYFLQLIKIKEIQDLMEKGLPMDEAERRVNRKRGKK